MSLDPSSPNIIWAGGASKIAGLLQFYNHVAKDLDFKPICVCLFDNDNEGREQANKIKEKEYSHLHSRIVLLPRYNGDNLDEANKKLQWEIEDFLPTDMIFKATESIFKKENYKFLTKQQREDRLKPAHADKQILKYIEECCTQNNPEKQPIPLDNEGMKKVICLNLCGKMSEQIDINILSEQQKLFLKKLAEL